MIDLSTAKPRQVESYLRNKIKEYWGDEIENGAKIYASHGFYSVEIPREDDFTITFGKFRKSRAREIVGYLKILAGK